MQTNPVREYDNNPAKAQSNPATQGEKKEFSLFDDIDNDSGTVILESTDNPALQAYRQCSNPARLEKLGYKVIEVLGQGSQGTVYKAQDVSTGAWVAIKVLNVDSEVNPNTPRRFLKTAQIASQLDHPNVARLLRYGQVDDMLYAVMEFVQGYSLNELIETQGRLQEAAAVDIMIETLHALDHLWSKGTAHRDIKPHNILITFDGHVKLVDLGLAKQFVCAKDGNTQQSTAITQANMRVGTPAFMSPEQVRGEQEVDVRSDIYSLGITLFKVLTGRIPFRGKAIEVMSAHLLYPLPPLRNFVPDISPMTERIIMKMTAKAPEARYQSPKELLRDFQALSAQLVKSSGFKPSAGGWPTAGIKPSAQPTAAAKSAAEPKNEPAGGGFGPDESISKVLPLLKEYEPSDAKKPPLRAEAPAPHSSAPSAEASNAVASTSLCASQDSISRVLGLLKEYDGPDAAENPEPKSPGEKKGPDDICRFLEAPTVITAPRDGAGETSSVVVRGDSPCVFTVEDTASISRVIAEKSGPFSTPMILVAEGRQKVCVLLNDGDELTFGRSADFSHVVLDDPQVSVSHCKVMRSGNYIVVQDCNSRNGTCVDGRRLEPGEVGWLTRELKVGRTCFRLVTEVF